MMARAALVRGEAPALVLVLVLVLGSAGLLEASVGAGGRHPLLSEGRVEDVMCNVEDVEQANVEQLHSILMALQNTTYMRLIRVHLDKECPYWNNKPIGLDDSCADAEADDAGHDDAMCTVSGSGPAAQQSPFSTAFDWEPDSNSVDRTMSDVEDAAADVFTEAKPSGCDEGSLPPTFWMDMCSNINPGEESAEHVNLQKNPERWTGYNGAHIWKAIYEENCFKAHGGIDDMCYEERVLYRLLSGMHSSINIHIAESYYPPRKGVRSSWAPNPKRFMQQFAGHPERLKNLHFAFVVMLRALQRAAPHFSSLPLDTGNSTEDQRPRILVRRLLDSSILHSCQPLFSAFDESLLFQGRLQPASAADTLKREFKDVFHNISVLLDCVACQKCRLHGKVALMGLGTALKILLLPDHVLQSAISRDETVAFFNTIAKFSHAIDTARRLTQLYWENYDADQDARRDAQDQAAAAAAAGTEAGERERAAPAPPGPAPAATGATSSGKPGGVAAALQDAGAMQDAALAKVALATAAGGWLHERPGDEDALVDAIFAARPEVLLTAKHYGADSARFQRHVCRLLSLGCGGGAAQATGGDGRLDAVVVGAGLAGLTTALTVAARGGRVTLVEREAFFGGNSAWASSGINAAIRGAPSGDSVPAFEADMRKSAGANIGSQGDQLLTFLTSESEEALAWVRDTAGLPLDHVGRLGGHSFPRTHRPAEGLAGSVIISALQKLVRRLEGEGRMTVRKKTEASRLLVKDGVVTGVFVKARGGADEELLDTRSVVITSGGFAADTSNASLLAEVRPDLLGLPTTNGQWARGDGHRLAKSAGAHLTEMNHVQVHPTAFIDPKKPEAARKTLCAEITRGVGAILLARNGSRFCNELGTRDYIVGEMMQVREDGQAAPRIAIVLPPKAEVDAAHHVSVYTAKGLLVRHETLGSLAEWLELDASGLRQTLSQYNADAARGSDRYGKQHFKNAPFPLIKGPFFAGHVTPALHYTMGGISVNTDGQALRRAEDGALQPIAGLYAAGEVVGGVHGQNRLGGNALTECVVFGRSVGRSIPLGTTERRDAPQAEPGQEAEQASRAAEAAPGRGARTVSAEELATHNTEADLWIALLGKVYDFTDFLEEHPAGPDALLDQAGVDGTSIFQAVHSADMLADFEPLGDLAATDAA